MERLHTDAPLNIPSQGSSQQPAPTSRHVSEESSLEMDSLALSRVNFPS